VQQQPPPLEQETSRPPPASFKAVQEIKDEAVLAGKRTCIHTVIDSKTLHRSNCSVVYALFLGLASTMYIYTVYIRYIWQVHHQLYSHIRCIYLKHLARTTYFLCSDTIELEPAGKRRSEFFPCWRQRTCTGVFPDSPQGRSPDRAATCFWVLVASVRLISRVGQNRIYTLCMTVYLVSSLLITPYIHRIYIWFWPTLLTNKPTCST